MSWWLHVLLGGVGYLFFLLFYLPANQAFSWLIPENFPLITTDVHGTLWQGHATDTFYQGVELGSADWSFRPLTLPLGQLSYEISLSDGSQQIKGDAGFNLITGTYEVSDLNGRIRAAKIPALIGQPYLQLSGDLDVDIRQIDISNLWLSSANGVVRWNNASIRKPVETQLGNLQFELSGDESLLKTQIKDISGPLKVDTVVELQPDLSYRIKGKIKQSGSSDQGLIGLLRNMGRALADGSTQIDYSGQLQ